LILDGNAFNAWEFGNDAYWSFCARPPGERESTFDNRLSLVCPEVSYDTPGMSGPPPPNELWLDLIWRVEQPRLPSTLKTFVHLVDAEGNIVSQFDGMGVYLPSLQAGDRFIQFVHLPRPEGGSEPLSVRVGLYDTRTNARLRTPNGRESVTVDLP